MGKPASIARKLKGMFFATERRQLVSLLAVTGSLALLSRIYYSAIMFNASLYSGDAYTVLLRSFMLSNGSHSSRLVTLWKSEVLIDLVYGFFIRILPFDPVITARIVSCAITIPIVVILTYIVYKYVNRLAALFFGILLALNPFFSMMSTEPEKAPMVLFFFTLSLLFLCFYRYNEKARRRNLAIAAVFFALMLLSYRTGMFFALCLIIIYVLFSWDLKYRGKCMKILSDGYLYILLGLSALFAVILPRLAETFVKSHSIYPSATSGGGAGGGTNQFTKYFNDLVHIISHSEDSAAVRFLEATRNYIGVIIFGLFLLALLVLVFSGTNQRRQRWGLAPFIVWAVVITVIFSAQYFCYSHNSRYPYYLVPAFMALAAYFLAWLPGKIDPKKPVMQIALLVVLLLFVVTSQARIHATGTYEAGRNRYYTHKLVADVLTEQVKVRSDEGIILQRWPSAIYYLLENDPALEENIYPTGWNSVSPDVFSKEFVQENNIRYFVYDKVGDDYYQTPDVLLDRLGNLEDIYMVKVVSIENDTFKVFIYYLDY